MAENYVGFCFRGVPVNMKNILLVDDSRAVHAYVKNGLKIYNVKLTHTLNGKEALDLLQLGLVTFDLILLDWEMPVLDGLSTFDSMTCKSAIPVIIMATKNSAGDISFILNKGVKWYVPKPFTYDVLLAKIESVFGEKLSEAK